MGTWVVRESPIWMFNLNFNHFQIEFEPLLGGESKYGISGLPRRLWRGDIHVINIGMAQCMEGGSYREAAVYTLKPSVYVSSVKHSVYLQVQIRIYHIMLAEVCE